MRNRFTAFSIAALLVMSGLARAVDPPAVPWQPDGPLRPWSVSGKIAKGKDVSAASLTAPGKGVVLSDETRFFQLIDIDAAKLTVRAGERIDLLPGEGTEIDLEACAMAGDGRFLYLLGSHSKARKKDIIEATRASVFQVPLDHANGRPAPKGGARASLRDWVAATPVIAAALDAPADGTGVDFEGLAEHDGMLFIAARAPLVEGGAVVLEIPANEVFGGGGGKRSGAKLHRLGLGPGLGIRSLERIADGYLLIAGASGIDPEKGAEFSLFHWRGPGSRPALITRLHDLPGKAEGMMVVKEEPALLEVLFWFDGAAAGGPRSLRLRAVAKP